MAEGRRVLVVDDDRPCLDLVREVLAEAGYEAITASAVPEALAAVAQRPPDLVFVEVNSPGLDGLAFVAAYRRMPMAYAPVVVITTSPRPEEMARRAGAAACLAKPFSLQELTALLERMGARPAG